MSLYITIHGLPFRSFVSLNVASTQWSSVVKTPTSISSINEEHLLNSGKLEMIYQGIHY